MNDRPIIANTANDFTTRMSINRVNINQEIAVLRGQLNALQTQGIITEETNDLLWSQIREITMHKNKIESDYYDMRNTLERHEESKKIALSALREISGEDSVAGELARQAINAITGGE